MQYLWFFLVLALLGVAALIALSGVRFIPNNRVGLVEKRWSPDAVR